MRAEIMTAGNQTFQKQANLSLVLRRIREHGMISRVELSRILGLKKSTVTNIIAELMDRGIVEQRKEGEASSMGGRKPVYLGIRPGIAGILGLEIELGFYRAVYLDLSGNRLWSGYAEVPPLPLEHMFDYIIQHIQKDIEATGVPPAGIGVAVPGSVDLEQGKIIESVTFKLNDFDFAGKISSRYSIPVFLENDTNCGAWGELWRRNDEKVNFLYLLIRFHFHNLEKTEKPGVGLGLVINGQVYYGSSFRAGELGSNLWDEEGTEYLHMSSEELLRIKEDPRLMEKFLEALFRKLSESFSILDPSEVFLAGDVDEYRDSIPRVLERLKDDSWFGNPRQREKISFSKGGEMEMPFGAACMVLERLYSIPQLGSSRGRIHIDWEHVFEIPETGASHMLGTV
ncbi:ROK family transcriptional regulator [Salinispira pacifica]|uniref:Putative ROK-family transcriptional regulator n=1 Tax=Salinispira pacifica TaxID=1307761 RepID=V5WK00_9SPIO|nr:ROK family transcriptional regulator [Salinispira pacifica]AHC15985.1 Putative ROK-family transcriptional regulator [Salinispira pacifica]